MEGDFARFCLCKLKIRLLHQYALLSVHTFTNTSNDLFPAQPWATHSPPWLDHHLRKLQEKAMAEWPTYSAVENRWPQPHTQQHNVTTIQAAQRHDHHGDVSDEKWMHTACKWWLVCPRILVVMKFSAVTAIAVVHSRWDWCANIVTSLDVADSVVTSQTLIHSTCALFVVYWHCYFSVLYLDLIPYGVVNSCCSKAGLRQKLLYINTVRSLTCIIRDR